MKRFALALILLLSAQDVFAQADATTTPAAKATSSFAAALAKLKKEFAEKGSELKKSDNPNCPSGKDVQEIIDVGQDFQSLLNNSKVALTQEASIRSCLEKNNDDETMCPIKQSDLSLAAALVASDEQDVMTKLNKLLSSKTGSSVVPLPNTEFVPFDPSIQGTVAAAKKKGISIVDNWSRQEVRKGVTELSKKFFGAIDKDCKIPSWIKKHLEDFFTSWIDEFATAISIASLTAIVWWVRKKFFAEKTIDNFFKDIELANESGARVSIDQVAEYYNKKSTQLSTDFESEYGSHGEKSPEAKAVKKQQKALVEEKDLWDKLTGTARTRFLSRWNEKVSKARNFLNKLELSPNDAPHSEEEIKRLYNEKLAELHGEDRVEFEKGYSAYKELGKDLQTKLYRYRIDRIKDRVRNITSRELEILKSKGVTLEDPYFSLKSDDGGSDVVYYKLKETKSGGYEILRLTDNPDKSIIKIDETSHALLSPAGSDAGVRSLSQIGDKAAIPRGVEIPKELEGGKDFYAGEGSARKYYKVVKEDSSPSGYAIERIKRPGRVPKRGFAEESSFVDSIVGARQPSRVGGITVTQTKKQLLIENLRIKLETARFADADSLAANVINRLKPGDGFNLVGDSVYHVSITDEDTLHWGEGEDSRFSDFSMGVE